MATVHVSMAARALWAVMFVFGLFASVVGALFLFSGPDMIVLAALFGGAGAFMIFESFGRMLGWEK